ncbi:nitrate/nitrite transporter [Marinobacter sp.]|uniref:MFS transporter n=1 Tax=Marinobacter sp. TaxID=50741 RepID=UPI00356603E6
MLAQQERKDDKIASLAIILPLAVTGFIVAAGCWTLFAVVGVHLRAELALSSLQFGVLLAAPMAVSALLAIPAGLAAQRYGARLVMLWCLAGLALCMLLLLVANSFSGYLIAASGLGLAGGFYSAGLQFVTSHCETRYMGLVLGIFGAGVTGAGVTYYLVPLVHNAYSWQGVPLAYLLVLLLVLALLVMVTDDDPSIRESSLKTPFQQLFSLLCHGRALSLCLYFGVVAGSFFALALWLPDFLSAQFRLHLGAGASLAQWFVIPGALAQIVGGGLSDHYGSTKVAARALIVCLLALAGLSFSHVTLFVRGGGGVIEVQFVLPLVFEAAFVVVLGVAMGCAMGSLQRMVILANRAEAALFAGFLLVAACSVAFVLPVLFSAVYQWLGISTAVFMILFLLFSGSLLMLARDIRCDG